MDNWFEVWFDSHYYHLLYNNRNDEEAKNFIDNLFDYLKTNQGEKVLDMACGKGRHSKYLASKGFDVCGIDLAANSIAEAKKMECDNLHFYEHDMRKIFRVNYFNVVCSFFTSMGYFRKPIDDVHQFAAMQAALKLNGNLVIDFMNAKKVMKNLVAHEKIEKENCVFEIHRFVENGFICKSTKVFEDNELKMTAREKVKAFTLNDFEKLLRQQNLSIKNIFGDYALHNFDEQNSDRLIIHAIKK